MSNQIVTEIINAIDNQTLDLQNVPQLQKLINDYRLESQHKIDELERQNKQKIDNLVRQELQGYQTAVHQKINQTYQNLIHNMNELNQTQENKLVQRYDEITSQLQNENSYQIILQTLNHELEQKLAQFQIQQKELTIKQQKIDESMKKLSSMTYFTRFKSIIATFLGVGLPIIFVFSLIIILFRWLISAF